MPGPRRDYYDVLGVDRAAGLGAIRKAFRARARRLHPDVSTEPDANERFRELVEAYSVLSRAPSRLLYDRVGYRGRGHGAFTPSRDSAARNGPERAAPVDPPPEVVVEFFDAAHGTTLVTPLEGSAVCRTCGGRGDASPDPRPCPACEGKGRLPRTARDGAARVLQIEPCARCDGRGTAGPPCAACGGTGRVDLTGNVRLSVPAGTRDGDRVALGEDGEVVVRVLPPPEDNRAVQVLSAIELALALALLALVLLD